MNQVSGTQRIAGFDLARAYAIFGMYIVNFDFCFGSFADKRPLGPFLNLFIGNSTSIFIILAGMGVSLMSGAYRDSAEKRANLKSVVLKRSWFLFAVGLLFYNWWPGDILHFYGGYMHIAAFMLFVPKRYYWLAGAIAILVFHALLYLIPVTTSWDFTSFRYADFWTPKGFLRNTFYNGWNAIFPWLAYFMLGMWLGRIDWQRQSVQVKAFAAGLIIFLAAEGLRELVKEGYLQQYREYIMSDYFPPYLPYMMITTGYALMAISVCMYVANRYAGLLPAQLLAVTGRMTLSLYVLHLTLGMMLLSLLTHKPYTGYLTEGTPVAPTYILLYAAGFFALSVLFCQLWSRRFRNGPLELLMRWFSA